MIDFNPLVICCAKTLLVLFFLFSLKVSPIQKITNKILEKQITNGLKSIKNISNIIIAYEPVWSIGTGLIPKPNDLLNSISFIKSKFRKKTPKVLYGGSVNNKNITEIKDINVIDGFLIGGASQSSKKFIDIIKKTFN